MDTVGAVIGPSLAFFFLAVFSNDYRKVFWLSMVPGVIAVLLILFFITEKRKRGSVSAEKPKLTFRHFDRRFKFFVLIAALFAVGNSSDVFLILRAQQRGIGAGMIPILYLTFNIVYSVTAVPAGVAADRFGKKRIILAGFILFALVYLGFSMAKGSAAIWGLFCLYGVFMGLTDGTQKAFLATIIPPDFKATAFGLYHTATGLAMFPASFIGGWLWDHVSPDATFLFGAITAALSSVFFLIFIITGKKAAAK
jgi:MFS family permease